MASDYVMTTRWSAPQHALIVKLQAIHGGVSKNDVLRIALARLAQEDGLLSGPEPKKPGAA